MKSVRDMTEEEFKAYTGFTRKQAQNIMLNQRYSVIPDRAMHPNAKISSPEPWAKDSQAKFLRRIGL
jgi:hypothetical protein